MSNHPMQRKSDAKAERAAKENDELKRENRLLREEIADNRSERKQVLALLDKAQISAKPSKRRFRLLRLAALGGAAYAVITKTGAVTRVKEWAATMKARSQEVGSDLASKGSEMTHQVGDAIEHTGRRLERASETIERSSNAPGT
jgi:hypothetical protein